MSAIRISRPGYVTQLIRVDDGVTPHVTRSGIKGGLGNPIVGGSFPVGESERDRQRRFAREHKARNP